MVGTLPEPMPKIWCPENDPSNLLLFLTRYLYNVSIGTILLAVCLLPMREATALGFLPIF
jgi:hypothetical protein